MGRDDPYRRRPWMIGDTAISQVNDDWSIRARCFRCGHERTLGRMSGIRAARACSTQGEFVARLTCSRCGARHAVVTLEFVGKRRD